jgi:hypothetical protein
MSGSEGGGIEANRCFLPYQQKFDSSGGRAPGSIDETSSRPPGTSICRRESKLTKIDDKRTT